MNRAFAAMAKVQRLMSRHLPMSDIGRLNRATVGEKLRVHPWTWRVLNFARELSEETAGMFDVTVGLTPAPGNWRHIHLKAPHWVWRTAPVQADLGGIAKGFAVDRAIAVLRRHRVSHAIVNAGGDIGVLGRTPQRILVRHPAHPTSLSPLVEISSGAVCTSANYLDAPGEGRLRRADGALLATQDDSISVSAPTCMVADALTKVVAALGPEQSEALLVCHDASALLITPTGCVTTLPTTNIRNAP